jgi:GDP-6-deoxy-D-talose 4-dehydrogenase
VYAPANHYAASKVAMELMARNWMGELPIVVVRPFNYTGIGQAMDFLIPKIVQHFALRRPLIRLGNMDVCREFNDVEWVCANYLKLLRFGKEGEVYNVCSGKMYSLLDVLGALRGMTGHALEAVVDASLIRHQEVKALCGNPQKLQEVAGKGQLERPLDERLLEMVAAVDAESGGWSLA